MSKKTVVKPEETLPEETLPEETVPESSTPRLLTPLPEEEPTLSPAAPMKVREPLESMEGGEMMEELAPGTSGVRVLEVPSTLEIPEDLSVPEVPEVLEESEVPELPEVPESSDSLELPDGVEDLTLETFPPVGKNAHSILPGERKPLKKATPLRKEAPQTMPHVQDFSANQLIRATQMSDSEPEFVRMDIPQNYRIQTTGIQQVAAEEPISSGVPAALAIPTSVEIENIPEVTLMRLDSRNPDTMPADEYILDTKQSAQNYEVTRNPKYKVNGEERNEKALPITEEQSGTYIYYDNMQGRASVATPEPVYIYSPRFRAVRQVVDLRIDDNVVKTNDIYTPLEINLQRSSLGAEQSKQQIEASVRTGRNVLTQLASEQSSGEVDGADQVQTQRQGMVAAQESRVLASPGSMDGNNAAWIADGMTRANTWTQNEELQVFIDKTNATVAVMNTAAPSVYSVQEGDKSPQVRIYKVASTDSAAPGETVDFVIYFENTGVSSIGNIVLVDSLTARLEIIEDSVESSMDTLFSYTPNTAGSQTLRWEVTQPLAPNERGAVKFRCLVR